MERLKALSADGRTLRKFEGLGRHGAAAHARAWRLAEAGFAVPPRDAPDAQGFVGYAFHPGRPLGAAGRGAALAAHLGRYAAARAQLCPADATAADQSGFWDMVRTNVALELGEPAAARVAPVAWARPAITDARLAPHEWIAGADGRPWKTDAAAHGDDHFFPGPTDVAWDLACAVVEWDLEADLREALLAAYQHAAGEDARPRLPAFTVAYAAFRARLAVMAGHASPPDDAARWRRDHARYARALRAALGGR
jgi:hypothetical protein